MRLKAVGVVRNAVRRRGEMPLTGAPSRIDILPRYRPALKGLRRGAHVWVLCWLHRADRGVLEAAPRRISPALGTRGVFALRSPDRPNPVSLHCARITAIKGRTLRLDWLDAIDATPVIDLKPYSPGIDCAPFAEVPDHAGAFARR